MDKERNRALFTLAGRKSQIQRKTPQLHQMADAIRTRDFRKFKRLDPYNPAWQKKGNIPPNEMLGRLDEISGNITDSSIPILQDIEVKIDEVINKTQTLSFYLRTQRKKSGIPLDVIVDRKGKPLPTPTTSRMENGRTPVKRKYVAMYFRSGVDINFATVENIRRRERRKTKSLAEFFRSERIYQDLKLSDLARRMSYNRAALNNMELGNAPYSRRAIEGLEQAMRIRTPQRLIEKQKQEIAERRSQTFYANRQSSFGNLPDEENQTLGDFLRRERTIKQRSAGSLSEIIGVTSTTLYYVEKGKISASDQVLAIYEAELGITIPDDLKEKNRQRRLSNPRRRRRIGNRNLTARALVGE